MKPVCSANGMNCIGGTMPRSGCCQRTSASAPTTRGAVERQLGLQEQAQLAVLDRVAQFAQQRQRLRAGGVERRRRTAAGRCRVRLAAYIATSARLSSVSASAACSGPAGHADAGAHVDLVFLERDRRVEGARDALRDRLRELRVAFAQQHRELVARQARHDVVAAHHLLAQAFGHAFEQQVAEAVARARR